MTIRRSLTDSNSSTTFIGRAKEQALEKHKVNTEGHATAQFASAKERQRSDIRWEQRISDGAVGVRIRKETERHEVGTENRQRSS